MSAQWDYIDTRYAAKQMLRDWPRLNNVAEDASDRIKILDEKLTSLGGGGYDAVRVSGGGDNKNDARLSSIISAIQEQEKLLDDAEEKIHVLAEAFSELTDQEQMVLTEFYISGSKRAAERVALELHISRSEAFNMAKRHLKTIAKKIYGW